MCSLLFNVHCMNLTVFCHLKLSVAAILGQVSLEKEIADLSGTNLDN